MGKSTTPSFTVNLPLALMGNQYKELAHKFYSAEKIYNKAVKYYKKQIRKMFMDPEYKNAKGKDRTDLIKKYKLTTYDIMCFCSGETNKKYKKLLDSTNTQDLMKRVAKSIEKYLYDNGRNIHYIRYNTLYSIGTANTVSKTTYDVETNTVRFVNMKLKVRNKSLNNPYIKEALTHKIKFIRIIRLPFNTGYRYYVQLILEGYPPNYKVTNNKGDVGIDIGTSTVAVSSKKACLLKELSPLNQKYVKQIADINKKMENSRRISNPDNYNPDGTIKKGKHTWKYSNNYKKLKRKYQTLNRKRAAYIKQFNETIANEILDMGNTVYIEDMNFKGLQRRAKKTEKNKNNRFKRKKRFGKTLQSRAPAQLVSIIDRKLHYLGLEIHKVDTKSFKASQYNHIDNTYKKKTLGQRETIIGQDKIQRDLYSAFLLMNSLPDLTKTDRDKCIKTYNNFKTLHDKCIEEIKQTTSKRLSSFGF